IRARKATGLAASVLLGAAVLESGWGETADAQDLNNVFGLLETESGPMTPRGRGHEEELPEDAVPRRFDSGAACVEEFARLFADEPAYRTVVRSAHTADRFARALNGTYSPNLNYGQTLIRVMRQFDLYRFDRVEAD
ncbi:MAG: glucosaminidase domain-containing protein, partial [Planctomycetota bacterium]